jgi:NADH-quinone oxidoreductase subunit J
MDYLIPIAFYAFAVLILGSAAVVVFSKKIIYAAFALLFTFFGVAGFYVLLNADFIAITQIMIYIGGILILIIFAVMLTTKISGVDIKEGITGKIQTGLAVLIVAIIAVTLIIIFNNVNWVMKEVPEVTSTIIPLGNALLTDYILAFEAASVLLLIAIIGAALIARRKKTN